MKSLIWGTGRHVDRTEEKVSSTNKKSENHAVFNDGEKRKKKRERRERRGGERREVYEVLGESVWGKEILY